MKKNISVLINEKISKVIQLLHLNQLGIVAIVNSKNRVLGTITDGDLRRAMFDKNIENLSVRKIMNKKPILGNQKLSNQEKINIMTDNKIYQLPVIDTQKKLIEITTLKNILTYKKEEYFPVLIMAGGFGKRLGKLTKNTPKPLLKIGKKTILETLIDNLISYGFKKFYISLHYKAEKIIKLLGDGSKKNINIEYLYEITPLGTAGAIRNLPNHISNFLMINSDVITNLNFVELIRFHKKIKSYATICAKKHTYQFPYGNLVKDKNGNLKKIVEKPELNYFINTGIYVFNRKEIKKHLSSGHFDCDELIVNLKKNKKKIKLYPIHESWIDIGTKENYYKFQK